MDLGKAKEVTFKLLDKSAVILSGFCSSGLVNVDNYDDYVKLSLRMAADLAELSAVVALKGG